MAERLILTGFMGVGKTTITTKTADRLDLPHYDTDEHLEASGHDIPALVKNNIDEFRKLEAEALLDLLDEYRYGVISTGGGIVSTAMGRNALRSSQVPVVWLDAPFDVLKERVKHDTGRERPLFKDEVFAKNLYDTRKPWYRNTSTDRVDADRDIEPIVTDIAAIALR